MSACMKEPCKECPFRRKSFPGWLGPWKSEELVADIPYMSFPCHKTIKQEGLSHDDPALRQCAGAAIFLNNKIQRSRHPSMEEAQDAMKGVSQEIKDSVFSNPQEFVNHHKSLIRDA